MASFTPTWIAQNFSYDSVYQITLKEPQQLLVGKERSPLAAERQPPPMLCPRAARSLSAGASNRTSHKTIPKTTSLAPSTRVRFVHPLLFLPVLPNHFMTQPWYSCSSSKYIVKDAKQSSFTYGIISWLLQLVKKSWNRCWEEEVGSREICMTPAAQSFPKMFFLVLQSSG